MHAGAYTRVVKKERGGLVEGWVKVAAAIFLGREQKYVCIVAISCAPRKRRRSNRRRTSRKPLLIFAAGNGGK